MKSLRKIISVFGSSQTVSSDKVYQEAQIAGQCLARLGIEVYSGGYGGIMEAVSLGAFNAGGKTAGVTCDIFGDTPANRYIHQEIKTPTLYSRLETLIESADAYLVFPGSTGTMAEFLITFEVASKFALSKPILFWGNYWKSTVEQVQKLVNIGDSRIPAHKVQSAEKLQLHFIYDHPALCHSLENYYKE